MRKSKAMKIMKKNMDKIHHQYEFVEQKSISQIIYSYNITEHEIDLPNLQLLMNFEEVFVDIFLYPERPFIKSENLYDVLRALNFLNQYLKGSSRMYVSDDLNAFLSLRLTYKQIKYMENESIAEIQFVLSVYRELLDLIYTTGDEGMPFEVLKMSLEQALIQLEDRGYV